MRILVTGGSGRLGKEIVKVFSDSIHPSHKEMDITDRNDVNRYLDSHNVDTIIHCAALTSMSECEQNPRRAWRTNVLGTKNLISSIQRHNPECLFVFISSPAVFKCDRGNYAEDDIPYPATQYGVTKFAGEMVTDTLKNYIIVRTNFVPRDWKPDRSFTDRFGTYIYSDTVARAIGELVARRRKGIVHVVGSKKLSMYELAKLSNPNVLPITTFDLNIKGLPKDMSLASNKWPVYDL